MSKKNVLLFGHSDADGHIITQQSIENLEKENFYVKDVVLDHKITNGYKFWEKTFKFYDFSDFDMIIIVDIMFKLNDPYNTFEIIKEKSKLYSTKNFIIIDHHPVEILEESPKNVDIRFTNSVYECCYGKPSDELMILASICDKDEKPIKHKITDYHRIIAKGISRASTDRKGLAGKVLLHLIKERAWLIFESLANEPYSFHKTFYGNRTSKNIESPILLLTQLLTSSREQNNIKEKIYTYG